jgi:hypothetical protein
VLKVRIASEAWICWSFAQPSESRLWTLIWISSWDPLKLCDAIRRTTSAPPAQTPAGQDPEARIRHSSHHSNAPIEPVSQSNLSKIIALLTAITACIGRFELHSAGPVACSRSAPSGADRLALLGDPVDQTCGVPVNWGQRPAVVIGGKAFAVSSAPPWMWKSVDPSPVIDSGFFMTERAWRRMFMGKFGRLKLFRQENKPTAKEFDDAARALYAADAVRDRHGTARMGGNTALLVMSAPERDGELGHKISPILFNRAIHLIRRPTFSTSTVWMCQMGF